ncbi:MAG TPA: NAD(P)-dependent oxidoreductase [Thermoleophilaceae bacterium]|nr:NAD(P)-dependent oxidoreductase [Thermoleophilaceae bacterium]
MLPLPGGRDAAEFLMPDWHDRETLEALPRLERVRVVQSLSAGTEWIETLVPSWAVLCNARGARDAAVAEWAVGALLGDAYGQLNAARTRRWNYAPPRELQGCTVLILGYGSIGQALERRLEPFGVTVVRVARGARDGVHAVDELPELVGRADAVVVLLPHTSETRGLVGAELLARMPDGALIVNAGRGPVVDTNALVEELRTKRLRAVLDVVDPEPLPPGHPLWELTLAITPHNSGDSAAADERAIRLGLEQLSRYARGEPLHNLVRAASSGAT